MMKVHKANENRKENEAKVFLLPEVRQYIDQYPAIKDTLSFKMNQIILDIIKKERETCDEAKTNTATS
jgi:hypothetical protein